MKRSCSISSIKKDDVVYEYDGIYEDTFVHEHPELFVFDGTYKVRE